MGFRINTNISAMNAHTNATVNNRSLDDSLSKLSSGLRINKAADDASGMVIADSLRAQANSLGQAISNANDGIGIIQVADKAMDEQLKILDTIKTKSIQAASDSQSAASRTAIQKDVNRLLEQLDNIAKTTAFNGTQLLSGNFSNKEFQVGAYSNQTIKTSIANTQSLAIGNTSTKTDQVQVGNFATSTLTHALDKNSNVITFTGADGVNAQGLAAGDTIRIDGVGDFTIQHISGTMTTGGTMSGIAITLDRVLGKTLSVGSTFGVGLVKTTAENLGTFSATAVTGGVTMTLQSTNTSGFAIGDKMNVTISDGSTMTYTLVSVAGASTGTTSGTLIWSAAAAGTAGVISNATVSMNTRSNMGTAFASSDYVQYTVEGVKLDGVQMTDSSGNGVAQTGLGRVADLINAASGQTGVKAVANTEINSNIAVQAGTLASNITINGTTILSAGASLVSGDKDNTLVSAINAQTSLTGVTASMESDGTLTLNSDGRAINLSGLSAAAGLNDGVYAGRLELVKQGGGDINVSSAHYTNAGLTTTNAASAKTLTDVTSSKVLSDLVYGQVDDNNDGLVNSSDKVGLLLTRKGATKAMDIVESAISRLDSIRADLGSVQNQLTVTVNNISVTQVNVKAAESQIRDVDFAQESANFSKYNILAQSGSYAMSQANAVQQNVLRLLQ